MMAKIEENHPTFPAAHSIISENKIHQLFRLQDRIYTYGGLSQKTNVDPKLECGGLLDKNIFGGNYENLYKIICEKKQHEKQQYFMLNKSQMINVIKL